MKAIVLLLIGCFLLGGCALMDTLSNSETQSQLNQAQQDFKDLVSASVSIGNRIAEITKEIKEVEAQTDSGYFSLEVGTALVGQLIANQNDLRGNLSIIQDRLPALSATIKDLEKNKGIPWWVTAGITLVGTIGTVGKIFLPQYAAAIDASKNLLGFIEKADAKDVKKLVSDSNDPKIHKLLSEMRLVKA